MSPDPFDESKSRYDPYFRSALELLHRERRYRVFADIERIAGRFPTALWHSGLASV